MGCGPQGQSDFLFQELFGNEMEACQRLCVVQPKWASTMDHTTAHESQNLAFIKVVEPADKTKKNLLSALAKEQKLAQGR